jgi:hypothetical protein
LARVPKCNVSGQEQPGIKVRFEPEAGQMET